MFGLSSDMTLVFMAAAFCAAVYLALCARPGRSWFKSVIKTLSVLLLAVIAVNETGYMLLAAALVSCAVGDFFLSREGDEAFLSGIGAFAIGHLAYAALFWLHPSSDILRISDGWPLTLALVLLGLVMIVLLFSRTGALRFAVVFYIPIILAMVLMAMTMPFSAGLMLILPAALLFMLSDLVLSFELFVLPDGHKYHRATPYAIWSFYWLSQALFLIAFLTA